MAEAMPPGAFLYTSESVTEGDPNKLCDRISDAVVDACLTQDPEARVACEACTKTGMVMVLGEVTTKASVNYEQVIREAVKAVGYDSDEKGLDWRTMNVIVAVDEQSPDLAQATSSGKVAEEIGATEHGSAFGYATDETPERMPLSHVLASKLCAQLDKVRKDGTLSWVRPNGWAQVTVEYKEAADGAVEPSRVHSADLCVAHQADVKPDQFEKDIMEQVVKAILPAALCDDKTIYNITSLKSSSLGGPHADSGMTGRKLAADSYGGWGSHSGGAFSGRDGTKVSRGATYGARWAARSLVEAKACKRCLVQVNYTPGTAQQSSINVHSYGTAKAAGKTDAELAATLARSFDFRLGCLQRDLGLKTPQFQQLSCYGQVGRADLDLAWEKPKALK